jgi:hypothetical protein
MFLGTYWAKRPESRDQAALRLTSFIVELCKSSDYFTSWFPKGWTKKEAQRRLLKIEVSEIAMELTVNHKDVGNVPIPELGYSLSIWNGRNADLGSTIGSDSAYVGNSVVLSLDSGTSNILSHDAWRRILERSIAMFDPDDAVIVSDSMQTQLATDRMSAAWLTYRRAAGIEEHPERR